MLRFWDWICVCCGHEEEILGRVGDPDPTHCGSTMEKVWKKAPGVHYRPQYSHGLGKRVSSSAEMDRELAKNGQWVASKSEINSTYGTDIFNDNVTVQPRTDQKLHEHVEQAARMLVEKNVLKSTGSGFEAVKR